MCLHIIACLCPPLAVACKKGCGGDLFLSCFLTCVGWIPGVCYACCVVSESEKSTTVIVNQQNAAAPAAPTTTHVVVNMNEGQRGYPQVPYPLTNQPQPQPIPYNPQFASSPTGQYPAAPPPAPGFYPSASAPNDPPPYKV